MHIEDHITIKGSGQCDPGRGHWSHTQELSRVCRKHIFSFKLKKINYEQIRGYLQNIYVYAIIHIHIHMFKTWIKAIRIIINDAGITMSDLLFFYYIVKVIWHMDINFKPHIKNVHHPCRICKMFIIGKN